MKNLHLFLLAAYLLGAVRVTTAQEKTVQVPYTCDVGNEFTIRIPVKLQGKSVEYVWYRNDTVVAEIPLTVGVTTIAYTIPADKAYGTSVTYRFKYRLNDGCEEWSLSPRYVVNFQPIICPAISAPGVMSLAAYSCSGGVTNAGTISIEDYASSCNGGVVSAGTISVDAISCSGGVTNAGTISIATAN